MSSQTQDSEAPPPPTGVVDLQIVGGGLAGLLAANLALDAGLSVRLIEKQRSVGGRAVSTDHDGFILNHGPHALYLSGELNATLQALGITPTGSPPPLAGAMGTIGDRTDVLPQGLGSLLKTSLLPARGKRHLATLMARLPRMKTEPLAGTTVRQWIDSVTDVPELRILLGGIVSLSTYSSAADNHSADAAVAQTKMAMGDGVIYLDHGWTTIVDALDRRLSSDRFDGFQRFQRINAAAIAVEADGSLQLIRTAAGTFGGANLLLAPGSPGATDRLLQEELPGPLTEQAGPPVQAAVMDLGLRNQPAVDIHLGLDTGLYYSRHSVADGLAPAGQALVSVARYVPPGDELPPDETKARLMAHVRAVGVSDNDITMSRYLHKLTVSWGMPMASRGGLAGRPGPALPDRPGMYIAGDWVGDRGLLADASAASAGDAVASIVADCSRRAATPAGATVDGGLGTRRAPGSTPLR